MTRQAGMSRFERDLLESIRQAKAGEYAAVHTPEAIIQRRRGRPAGSVKADAKVAWPQKSISVSGENQRIW